LPRCLLDTGFWISLCDPKDLTRPKEVIEEIYDRIAAHEIVLPWPVVYETLRTKFVRNKIALELFGKEIKASRVKMLDDSVYREIALELVFESSLRNKRPLSFVDCVLRAIIDDIDVKVDYFITFNVGDFHDICAKRQVEL
jgi:hypothetical protein